MEETWLPEEGYWHAFDARRSVSLSSIEITDGSRPVSAAEMIEQGLPRPDGTPVEQMPAGLTGQAAIIATVPPALASRALSGVLVTEGRVLIATITTDDLDLARRIWLSIRLHTPRLRVIWASGHGERPRRVRRRPMPIGAWRATGKQPR
jgi:hypothetical protein